MACSNWIGITDRKDEFVLGYYPLAGQGTERTAVVAQRVSDARGMEVRSISIELLRITDATQSLQIEQIIRPTSSAGDDMVNLERSLLIADTARLASPMRSLEDFVTEGTGNGVEILRAMMPDGVLTLGDIFSDLGITQRHQRCTLPLVEHGDILGEAIDAPAVLDDAMTLERMSRIASGNLLIVFELAEVRREEVGGNLTARGRAAAGQDRPDHQRLIYMAHRHGIVEERAQPQIAGAPSALTSCFSSR